MIRRNKSACGIRFVSLAAPDVLDLTRVCLKMVLTKWVYGLQILQRHEILDKRLIFIYNRTSVLQFLYPGEFLIGRGGLISFSRMTRFTRVLLFIRFPKHLVPGNSSLLKCTQCPATVGNIFHNDAAKRSRCRRASPKRKMRNYEFGPQSGCR
jgi:hypothetical protein